jgi:prepilin-type N-terminal cleavage/methylation domain-containing protein
MGNYNLIMLLKKPLRDSDHFNKSSGEKGFSLIELSIVLVVIGLLVGGVMAGKSLIRAAELRRILSQKDEIITTANIFKDKYDALPGDMINATSFWGTKTGGACPNATVTVGTQTCDGNGDGIITHSGVPNSERLLAWQHLANAELMTGKYLGTWLGANGMVGQDYFLKGSSIDHWLIYYVGVNPISDMGGFEGDDYHNSLMIISANGARTYLMSPEEAWNIDKKTDDGKPGLGNFVTGEDGGIACNNVAASNSVAIAETATYNLSNKSEACFIIWKDIW